MNIELDDVIVMDVSDYALEMAAGGAQVASWTFHETWGKYCRDHFSL